ncbi:helix-turn-helix domain-containing protein [Actinomadura kijaniata]|uniref:helix-turn-helix domain-containing protein n=1 Tax=Actinomadura kijaniata TaxID=46161 RepID=UPI0012FA1FB6|nr:helix-turn-helix domain-containing protein [Actinomadura kijaniata]
MTSTSADHHPCFEGVADGTERAAWAARAVQLRLDDPTISAEQVAALRHVSAWPVWRYWHASGRFTHRGRALTDTDREAIVAAHASGEPVAQIAEWHRVYDSTVHKVLRAPTSSSTTPGPQGGRHQSGGRPPAQRPVGPPDRRRPRGLAVGGGLPPSQDR